MKAFIIGAPWSGAGKTTISLGLMGAFVKRGLTVQPFKTGPDYIDPSYHEQVCRRPSYNLDSWMMGEAGVVQCFLTHMNDANLGIIEGVMGLFDGKDISDERGSTAHLAKILNLPVILIIDGKGMARSTGALIRGFNEFDPMVRIMGVIFNRIRSKRHFHLLKEVVEKYTRVEVLGFLPEDKYITLPERHLGLVMYHSLFKNGNFSSHMDYLIHL